MTTIIREIKSPSNPEKDKCVFTVMSGDYLANSLASLSSMKRFEESKRREDRADYWIVVCDDMPSRRTRSKLLELDYNLLHRAEAMPEAIRVHQRVSESADHDCMRWMMKPVAFAHFLQTYKRIIYVDNDCYFVREYDFLFEDLQEFGILLTPHWRPITPSSSQSFILNFSDGMFNAGFVGISASGVDALNYWLNACLFRCEKDRSTNLFVDQKYLDLIPIAFPDICKVVEHKGCNVASWNRRRNVRTKTENGLVIDGVWPLIFVHLSAWEIDRENLSAYHADFQHFIKYWQSALDTSKMML
jgi:hypothetical protein